MALRRVYRGIFVAAALAFGVNADQQSLMERCSQDAKTLKAPDPIALRMLPRAVKEWEEEAIGVTDGAPQFG